MHLYTHNFITG